MVEPKVMFTLPSGRVVEIHEPTFGEELSIVSSGVDNIEEMVYAKLAIMVPGVTREEVAAMDRKDGRALVSEVGRVWDGRPADQEAPFENSSNEDSPEPPSTILEPQRASTSSASVND